MTEKEVQGRSEQDDFSTEMILSLQELRRETEMLTQSLGLPMEAKYDLLAAMYHQLPFFYAETTSNHPLQELVAKRTLSANNDSSLLLADDLPHSLVDKEKLESDCSIEQEKTSGLPLYPFQQRVYDTITSGRNVILYAPTGSGKTHAALLPFTANLARGGEALPLTCRYIVPQHVLANQLYRDHQFFVEKFEQLMGVSIQKTCWQLGHASVAVQTSEQREDPQMEATLTFCTSDQLLASFLNVPYSKGFQEMNPTVAGVLSSYLVLDEFHLYPLRNSKDAFSERMAMLQMLRLLKRTTPFILMTATLSSALLQRLQTLLNAEVVSVTNKQELETIMQGRKRTFWCSETPMNAEMILTEHCQRSANKCTLVICNNIERAQCLYLQLKRAAFDGVRILLLHNRFTIEDRQMLSQEVEDELGSDKWHNGNYSGKDLIVVTTQVIEVGFDISVQVMHTEIAPASSLIQRAGRCARFARQQGKVWIYPLPQNAEGNASSTFPYSQTLCATTWDALKAFHAQEVGFLQEQELINMVHTQEDEMFIDQYERSESHAREQILTSMNMEDRNASSSLLRDIAQVQILIHDDPGSTIQEALWQWESFSVHPSWLMARWQTLQEHATQLDLPVCWEPIIQEEWNGGQKQTIYTWQSVTSCKVISRARLLAFPRQLARYDGELGFILLDSQHAQELGMTDYQSRQLPVLASNYEKHRLYQPNYQEHRRDLLRAYNFHISREIHYTATRLEQEIGLEPGTIDKAIKRAIAYHYLDKQKPTWQQWTQTVMEVLDDAHQGGIWKNISSPDTRGKINRQKSLETWLYFLIGRAFHLSSPEAA